LGTMTGPASKILVVDDDEGFRRCLAQLLQDEGYAVTEAESAETALELFRRERHAVVITDIKMGRMSGLDLVRDVRNEDADVQFILITGYASLDTAVTAMRAGAYDYITRPLDDIASVSAIVRHAAEKHRSMHVRRSLLVDLKERNEELAEANRVLSEQAIRDPLTGLYNHRHFQEMLTLEIVRSRRHGRVFSLLMLDVDHFKTYNDRHGHPAGDRLLRELAALLAQRIRMSDLLARYGGEEFALILRETPRTSAVQVAANLCDVVRRHGFSGRTAQAGGPITISVGVAGYPDDALEGEDLVLSADQALYRAKHGGRDRVAS